MGGDVISVQTDVSDYEAVKNLAQVALDTYGAVHLVVNNAGVGAGTTTWESTIEDWKWVLDVNLWGVIHGVKVFTPILLEQDTDCHIVNVSSSAGLNAGTFHSIYKASKHAVTSLSETLYFELGHQDANVGVSVFCPGFVKTDIITGNRNRPAELQNTSDIVLSEEMQNLLQLSD